MFPIIGVLRSFPSVSQLCTHRGLVYPSCHHPKKKTTNSIFQKFRRFPSFNPTPFSRCEHVFAAKPPKLWQLWQQSKGAAHGDGDLSGSLGKSPSRRDRDNEAQMLQRSIPPWRYLPGWGYFRRPKGDACSCDSKFFFVKRSKVAEKNDKFDIHWTSVLRIQYTSSLQAEFYSREFCWKCKIWMKLLQLLWVDACWFLPQMPDTTSKVQRPRSSEPLQKKK